jgi:NADH-quinone oxidoreductase subunit N
MSYLSTLYPAYAEIFLLVMACTILIVDLFVVSQRKLLIYLLVQLTLAGLVVITMTTQHTGVSYLFNNMFVDDMMSDLLKVLSYMLISMILVYSRGYLKARGLFTAEFMVLTLFALLGMMVMISASHFLSMYIGLELMSLSLYAMVALQRDSADATEAAMKYFILGALASGLLLYGMSMLYGATGTLDVLAVSEAIKQGVANPSLLVFGLVFVVAGLAFKLGAVPFHMWVPDVYQGAPTPVVMLIGSAPKLAAFAFIMRLLVDGLQPMVIHWAGMLTILAVLSMALGNISAIAQINFKRMLAYSSIAHMGFFLLGVLSGGIEGYGAAMFYIVVYSLMSLGALGIVLMLSRAGYEADTLDAFKGLNQRRPMLAFLMLLLMFSMAGVPPTVGFYAKFSVLEAIVNTGHIELAVMAVLFSLIGAYYYLRIVKLMYFDAPESNEPIVMRADSCLLITFNGFAVLALGIMPGWLLTLCSTAVQRSLLLP